MLEVEEACKHVIPLKQAPKNQICTRDIALGVFSRIVDGGLATLVELAGVSGVASPSSAVVTVGVMGEGVGPVGVSIVSVLDIVITFLKTLSRVMTVEGHWSV